MNCLSCSNNFNYYSKTTNCLKCEKYINYLQTECINSIPDGYFLLDEKSGIIDKCHNLCKTCDKASQVTNDIVHMNCRECLYNNINFKPPFEGNCPETESNDNGNSEDNSSKSHTAVVVIVIIVIILIILVVAFLLYRKVKSKDIDYKNFNGKVISMEEEGAIN